MQTANYTYDKTKTTITFDGKFVKYAYFDIHGFKYASSISANNVPNSVGGLSNFHQIICKTNETRTDTNISVSIVDDKHIKISFVCKYGDLLFDFDIVLTFVQSVINYGQLDNYMQILFPSNSFDGNRYYYRKTDVENHFAFFKRIDSRFTFAFLHKIFRTDVGTYFVSGNTGTTFYIAENERNVVFFALLEGLQKLIYGEKNTSTTLDEICKKYE